MDQARAPDIIYTHMHFFSMYYHSLYLIKSIQYLLKEYTQLLRNKLKSCTFIHSAKNDVCLYKL